MDTQRWQLNWDKLSIFTAILPITVGVPLITATNTPVSAQSVLGAGRGMVSNPITTNSFIYGSPIPSPIPVNPINGVLPSPNYYPYPATPNYYPYPATPNYYSYPATPNYYPSSVSHNYYGYPASPNYYPYPQRRTVVDSTLVNPVLVNPRIRNSTLINPVILNAPSRLPIRSYGQSRIILSFP